MRISYDDEEASESLMAERIRLAEARGEQRERRQLLEEQASFRASVAILCILLVLVAFAFGFVLGRYVPPG